MPSAIHSFTSNPGSFNWIASIVEGASIITSAGVVLRESDELADVAAAAEERHPAVEAESCSSMGWSAIFKSVQQEAELVAGLFIGEARHANMTS